MISVVANLCWLVPGEVGGTEEYAVRLLRAVAAAAPSDVEVTLAGPAALGGAHPDLVASFPTAAFRGPVQRRPYRVAVESTWLPRRSAGADLVHHLGGRLPARRRGRSVVTVHDIQPLDLPEHFSAAKRAYLGAALPRSTRGADLVCAVSQFVADGIVARFGVDPDRVRVVPSTYDTTTPSVDDPLLADLTEEPVILYPAITHPHKDHATLLAATRRLAARRPGIQLVLTGGRGRAEEEVRRLAGAESPGLTIRRLGRVAPPTLQALLRRADVLAFPSHYEGFGLPVLEAFHAGTPVVAAAATALPEVAGGAALLPAPGAVEEWVDALDEVLTDGATADRLVAAGRRRSEEFAPPSAAARLLGAWRAAAR